MNTNVSNFAKYVINNIPKYVKVTYFLNNHITLYTKPQHISNVLEFLKNNTNCQYKILIDITAVDYPNNEKRFCIVYNLLSIRYNCRVTVKTYLAEDDAELPSVMKVFSSSGWYEREIWDLYGVFFSNHPDLRRILTDYGFEGYPFRRDFPLSGYSEVRYDDEQKRVVSEPLELAQEFRYFDFNSGWDWK